ncbi:C87A3-like protein [Mya arenaria]|uniref:C87A3-like protein n=1 Tax=Mya arenaria TaxID=6604 RepID=A0ABY7FF81_MYAAR|nr:C87A3-like protein [Mya arenaria]
MSAKVPGSAGLPLLGDRSYEFYKDPIKFQHKYMENTKSRVFLARFLNKPTIFVGSNHVVHEVLTGEFADSLRESLKQLFTEEAIETYQSTIERIVKKSLSNLDTGLAIEVCLGLFLGLDFSQPEADVIADLTITHWHGIISVPLAVKVPLMSESTYSKAMDAKRKLLEIIHQRRIDKRHEFVERVEGLGSLTEESVNNHLLLFTSALVPKALSSILTSFDFSAGGFRFPAGHGVLYMTYTAQRDRAVFEDPDTFNPDRWTHKNANDRERLYCFGMGPRKCVGQNLVSTILKTVIRELLEKYTWEMVADQDLPCKCLPVYRPRNQVLVKFKSSMGQDSGYLTSPGSPLSPACPNCKKFVMPSPQGSKEAVENEIGVRRENGTIPGCTCSCEGVSPMKRTSH